MAKVLTGISGNLISAASAGFAPTNSADVSAIASAYQVVSATATQLYAGTAYVTSVNGAPLSASRAGNAANASMANSAYYDGTGRLISSLPDSAAVSAIASAYAESAASSKQDELTFSYDENDRIDGINGSALAGQGGGGGSVASPSGTIIVTDGTAIEATNSAIGTAESFGVNDSGQANYTVYSNSYEYLGSFPTFKSKGIGLIYNSSTATRTAWVSANTTLGNLVSSFVLPASSVSAGGLLSTSNINSIWDSRLKIDGGSVTLSGSYPVLFVYPDVPYSAVKELAWKDDIPASISLGLTYNNYVSSLNNMPLSASYAGVANTASYARYDINSRPLSSLITKSDIPSIVSPRGTISVTDYDIEATNSAVVTGAFPGYSLQTASYAGVTTGPDIGITVTLPLAHPNAELVVGLGYGYAGTASAVFDGHTSTAYAGDSYGPATATLKVPNATTARIYTDTYRSVDGVSASALYGTGITGVAELAWASALPTYSYDSEDKISAINGSAIAGGGGGGEADWSAESGQPGYIENKPVPKTLVAGAGITITENSTELVVASTNTLYTAGSGLTLNGTTFAVDTAVVQGKITYGYDASGNISGIDGSSLAGSDPEATDLYVQSPLYTGVSGGSAYIGWNNETVLYSNYTGRPINTGSTISLNESPLNFQYIEVYLNGTNATSTAAGWANSYQKIDTVTLSSVPGLTFVGLLSGNSTWWDVGCAYAGVSSTAWTKVLGYTKQVDSNASGQMANVGHLNIWKVVGLNRTAGE